MIPQIQVKPNQQQPDFMCKISSSIVLGSIVRNKRDMNIAKLVRTILNQEVSMEQVSKKQT